MKRIDFTFRLIATLFAVACLPAGAQFYQLSTNLAQTNYVAASSTQTSTVTNTLDVRRYRTIAVAAAWSGSTTATGAVTLSYQGSLDGTNWDVSPRWYLVGTNLGTNRVLATTNLAVLDASYLRPCQVVNGSSANLTNLSVLVLLKDSPRN